MLFSVKVVQPLNAFQFEICKNKSDDQLSNEFLVGALLKSRL